MDDKEINWYLDRMEKNEEEMNLSKILRNFLGRIRDLENRAASDESERHSDEPREPMADPNDLD